MKKKRLRMILTIAAITLALDVAAAQLTDMGLHWLAPSSFRRPSPIYHHDLKANVDTLARWGPLIYTMRTNALGLRSAKVGKVPLKAPGPRLLVIGDSFTEGVGVSYEETFAGRIAAAYGARGGEVLNAGVVSYAPSIYHRKVRYLIEEVGLRVDAIAVFIDFSDIANEAFGYRLDQAGNVVVLDSAALGRESGLAVVPRGVRGLTVVPRVRDWLVRNSLIFRFGRTVKKTIQTRRRRARAKRGQVSCRAGVHAPMWDVHERLYRRIGADGLRRAAGAMDRLYRLTRRHRIRLIIAVYPWPRHIAGRHVETRQVRFWRAWAAKRRVGFLDLFPVFITKDPVNQVIGRNFILCDMHWNANGHKRVADAFLKRFPEPPR